MCSAALLQTQIRRVVIAASGAELTRLLGPRAIHLEDLRADYGHQILIERGRQHDEGLKVLARSRRQRWPAKRGIGLQKRSAREEKKR